jgi:hypothetical protein
MKTKNDSLQCAKTYNIKQKGRNSFLKILLLTTEENPVKGTKITGHNENFRGITGGLDGNLKQEYREVLLTVEGALSLVRINSDRNCFKGKNTDL